MAVVRQARSAPPYGLIFFAFLWVISTAIAVIFYLQVAGANSDRTTKAADLAKATSDLQKLQADKSMLTAAMTGSSNEVAEDAVEAAVNARRDAGKPGLPMTQAIAELSADVARAKQAAADAATRLTEVTTTYDNNVKSIAADRDGRTKANDDLKTQMADLSKQLAEAQEAATASITAKEKDLSDLQFKYDADIRDKLVQIQQVQDQLDGKEKQVVQLEDQLAKLKPQTTGDLASMVDGKIIQTFPGQDTVYIDLGRKDRVSIGLTFAVYDPNRGIGSNEAKGKGQIEVIEVGETQSLARILHTEPNETILPNDVIGNVIYHKDRTRTYHFFVYGEFDLDGDGIHTAAERDKVKRMIVAAGGTLDDTITTQTDFVVLGAPPGEAQPIYDVTSDQGKDLLAQRQKELKQYDDVTVQAKQLSVPILNENRFLALIGYFNTTAVPQPLYGQ